MKHSGGNVISWLVLPLFSSLSRNNSSFFGSWFIITCKCVLLNSILKWCCISTLPTILFHSHTLFFGKGGCLVASLLTSGNAVLSVSAFPMYIHVYVHIHKLILPRRLEHGNVVCTLRFPGWLSTTVSP